MLNIHVPAERWYEYSEKIALCKLAEQSTDEIISVPAFEHGGFLYMSNGALYRPFDSSQSLELYAYRLLPEELFTGSTFSKYHDEQAILEGKRKRGNLTGLLVSVRKTKMVCSRRVCFIAMLPSTAPISLAEAMNYDERARKYGWRAFSAKGVIPSWGTLNDHPVALYVDPERDLDKGVLFWTRDGQIMEMSLSPTNNFNIVHINHDSDAFNVPRHEGMQACLF